MKKAQTPRPTTTPVGLSSQQRKHYQNIHSEYECHYFDELSMLYREQFIIAPMLRGLDLNNKDVADLACGSGHNSREILKRYPLARIIGFDILPSACLSYRNLVGREAFESDLTRDLLPEAAFDAVFIAGGLHHCVSDLSATLNNIARALRPGGLLIMVEPNNAYWLQPVRNVWYHFDRYFDAKTEEALSHDTTLNQAQPLFGLIDVRYMGGPGYFLILNSLLFRLPTKLKKSIAPLLMSVERLFNHLPGKIFYPYFVARWVRK